MKKFNAAIKQFKKARLKNKALNTLVIGRGENGWKLIYCEESGHYYVMSLASANMIQSGCSAIHKAYRVDEKTGLPEAMPTRPSQDQQKKATPRIFAVKIFNGEMNATQALAKNEFDALSQHHFAEHLVGESNQPIIISDFHLGETLSDTSGKPNVKLLQSLSLQDRMQLILQIINQYSDIHTEHREKSQWLHVDIKGSNIIIEAELHKNAWVIDFGSAKKLEGGVLELPTSLMGMTLNAVPREAISKERPQRYVPADAETGFLSKKSDVYALTPVLMMLLGCSDPYQHRRESVMVIHPNNNKQMIDLLALQEQIESGFSDEGLLIENTLCIPGKLQVAAKYGFKNASQHEAPNDETILNDPSIRISSFILYKNELLFVDKTNNTVSNRKNPRKRDFEATLHALHDLETTEHLTQEDFDRIRKIMALRDDENLLSLHDLVAPLIKILLNQMQSINPDERPTMNEVFQFFKLVNKVIVLAKNKQEQGVLLPEAQKEITLHICQMNLILEKGLALPLDVEALKNEPLDEMSADRTTVEQFDFDQLLEQPDQFEQLGELVKRLEDPDGKKVLKSDDLQFLSHSSEGVKAANFIIAKLLDLNLGLESTEIRRLKRAIRKRVDSLSDMHQRGLSDQEEPLPCNEILRALPTALLSAIFLPSRDIELDSISVDAFIEHEVFIREHFRDAYGRLCEVVNPIKQLYPGSAVMMEQDGLTLFKTISSIRQDNSGVMNEKLKAQILHRLALEATKEVEDYLRSIALFKNSHYQRYSFFGLFGHTVGEKRYAATQFIKAVKTGNYEPMLMDKRVMSALTNKTLGRICKPFIAEIIEQKNERRQSMMRSAEHV